MRRDTFVGHLNRLVPSMEHGFVPSTIDLRAREREVSIQTLYNSMDNQPGILP